MIRPLALATGLAIGLLLAILSMPASAQQTVIIHQPVQRVIVEHHYPAGVTHIPGQSGSRTYVTGGHYGPSTCYRECFHQGVSGGHVHGHRHSGWSVGVSVSRYDRRGRGFSVGGSVHGQ